MQLGTRLELNISIADTVTIILGSQSVLIKENDLISGVTLYKWFHILTLTDIMMYSLYTYIVEALQLVRVTILVTPRICMSLKMHFVHNN